ncbi:MAG: PadR family transcriptional regulator [Actinomycetia bacterium]|nr:PadR family transcriptional regulator [Actinomycetes bacterium]MCP4226338.1 PadR family transcriptional regulator [Actinomycetes bacterium]MCP5031789.1 PadR family transcriptional regulator [Actinomycetes bacterium]
MGQRPPKVAPGARSGPDLSLTEWVVLALLGEEPVHGFALARLLQPEADLGRILTVHRPQVYRALDRLVMAGLAEPHHTEPGDAGPNRTVHRLTRRGHSVLDHWFAAPVAHVRDLRIELLVKLRLGERARRDPTPLLYAQQAALAGTLSSLTKGGTEVDVVDRWRYHNARAATAFLDDLLTNGL